MLGLAFVQYVEDYDGKYPAGTHPAPLDNLSVGWAGQIYPYVKSDAVYKCHVDQTKANGSKPYQVPVSYGYNWNFGNKALFTVKHKALDINPASTKDIVTPARTVLLCEAFGTTADVTDSHGIEASSPVVLGSGFTYTSSIDGDGSSLRYATGILRSDPGKSIHVGSKPGDAMSEVGVHTGRSNFVFADGHAKCIVNDQISAGGTNNISPSDCTAGQGLMPKGKAGSGMAAGTGCSDPALVATFSIR
jgi:prepilin-type processing-associated H-X9-DG protein